MAWLIASSCHMVDYVGSTWHCLQRGRIASCTLVTSRNYTFFSRQDKLCLVKGILTKGHTRHANAWLRGPFWQDTLDVWMRLQIINIYLVGNCLVRKDLYVLSFDLPCRWRCLYSQTPSNHGDITHHENTFVPRQLLSIAIHSLQKDLTEHINSFWHWDYLTNSNELSW